MAATFSVSGLNHDQRLRARERVVQAAELAWNNAADVRYTQDGRRWNGIRNNRDARLGKFPHWADCSSFVTWCLWNGLFLTYGLADEVNGQNWEAGYTGSLFDHGAEVPSQDKLLRGDLVFYDSKSLSHVAISVGRKNGIPMVISHGQEDGPHYLRYDYRTVRGFRRYI